MACVSPYEAAQARALGVRAVFVPNTVDHDPPHAEPTPANRSVIVTAGRVTAQKDPYFFADVVHHLRAAGLSSEHQIRWVGDGAARQRTVLENAGVTVLGWRSRDETLLEMRRAAVYLHTAAWEGNPMTLLEATRLGVPIVARSIPSLESLGFAPALTTPEKVAAEVLSTMGQPHTVRSVYRVQPSATNQARALRAAYETARAR